MPNRLADETSPYLLQHRDNPVDWYPWGPEALERAKNEDMPIFLSIGYSACHWCHVMEHESFEDEETAAVMNALFVSVKVDREERPDLDSIYMQAVQSMTGRGGWPMSVFLTPDGRPFYGGTYYPDTSRHGMPSFTDVLKAVADSYHNRRGDVLESADRIAGRLAPPAGSPNDMLTESILRLGTQRLGSTFDWTHGGFGGAPKFPQPMTLELLLRAYARDDDDRALQMVEFTLERMARGGIYDQLGGGFHRYSVDAQWLTPHFEKMLYDNALLSRVYLHAFQITKKRLYRLIVEETLDYVLREMTDPAGGFYSAQDADSEGVEGKFFVWTPAEIAAELGVEKAAAFAAYFDVTQAGNFEGKNILNVPDPPARVAENLGMAENDLALLIQRAPQAALPGPRGPRPPRPRRQGSHRVERPHAQELRGGGHGAEARRLSEGRQGQRSLPPRQPPPRRARAADVEGRPRQAPRLSRRLRHAHRRPPGRLRGDVRAALARRGPLPGRCDDRPLLERERRQLLRHRLGTQRP